MSDHERNIDTGAAMDLGWLVEHSHSIAIEKGWHEERRTFGDIIALCHAELSEAVEEFRQGHKPTEIYYEGYDLNNPIVPGQLEKPCGIPIELADVVIRIADYCGLVGIDLDRAVKLKLLYNESRPYRHGGKAL